MFCCAVLSFPELQGVCVVGVSSPQVQGSQLQAWMCLARTALEPGCGQEGRGGGCGRPLALLVGGSTQSKAVSAQRGSNISENAMPRKEQNYRVCFRHLERSPGQRRVGEKPCAAWDSLVPTVAT